MDRHAIAALLHVSVRMLHRAFANESTSVMGYVRDRRLERARQELTTTTWTVAEIAARWNFADSSHFVRAYKTTYGQTPTEQRRLVGGRLRARDAGLLHDVEGSTL